MKRFLGVMLVIAFFLQVFFAYPGVIFAQQDIPLQISPTRQEIEVDPGESATINVKFFNFGSSPTSGILKAADFIVTGSTGETRIIENPDQASPRFSGAQWIELPYERMAIPADDKITVQAKINVPVDARPGGRYVSLYFEPVANIDLSGKTEREAGSAVSPRIGALIFIRVKGPITEKALISRLFAPIFKEYGPINVEADILNRGDYHIEPRGSISLQNMLGGIVDQKKIDGTNVFPDTARTFAFDLGEKWMFGKYTIAIKTSYGEGGHVIERSIETWVFPWKIALVVLLAFIIVIILLRYIIKNLIRKPKKLEEELEKEHEEIEKLRHELKEEHQ